MGPTSLRPELIPMMGKLRLQHRRNISVYSLASNPTGISTRGCRTPA